MFRLPTLYFFFQNFYVTGILPQSQSSFSRLLEMLSLGLEVLKVPTE